MTDYTMAPSLVCTGWNFAVHVAKRLAISLYSEFHQESLSESTRWQRELAGVTVNPLLGESLLLLLPQMNWHLREEKEARAPAEIVTVEGTGGGSFCDKWGSPRTFSWCCVYPASVVSRAPTCTEYGPASRAHDAPASIRWGLKRNASRKSLPRVFFFNIYQSVYW